MQGLMADLFARERCWMRGEANTRWRFAAMGIAGQMAQGAAWQHQRAPGHVHADECDQNSWIAVEEGAKVRAWAAALSGTWPDVPSNR